MSWKPTAESVERIDHARAVIEAAHADGYKPTLRRVFYSFVSANMIPNTEHSYKALGKVVTRARWEGLLDLACLDDEGRTAAIPGTWNSPAELLRGAAQAYRSDWWADHGTVVEVWTEKAAVTGIVEPVANRWGVGYLAARGYASLTALSDAADRWHEAGLDGRDVVIVYVGDHDPSGLDMDRDLQSRFNRLTDDGYLAGFVDLRRVALTREQIEEHELPPQPTKRGDSRARGWSHEGSWELDALPADVLRDTVNAAIADLAPDDIDDRRDADDESRDRIKALAAELA